jgi:alanyl-tRNA synthetase
LLSDFPAALFLLLGWKVHFPTHLSSLPTSLSLVLDFLPDKAFFLYNTLGFPINLTELMAQEAGMSIHMEGFAAKMEG